MPDDKQKPFYKRWWFIGIAIWFGLAFISNLGKSGTNSSSKPENAKVAKTGPVAVTSEEVTSENEIKNIGNVMTCGSFDVTLNKVYLSSRVSTGNEFLDKDADPDNKFLILNVKFKNIDTTGRTLLGEGDVYINYNGKRYEFDKTETIMSDGWGIFLDALNPLTSKTTNLVYSIPNEIKGEAYWIPPDAAKNQRFSLGVIK